MSSEDIIMIPISSMLGLMLVSKYKRNDDYNLL